jgi:GST-like protein
MDSYARRIIVASGFYGANKSKGDLLMLKFYFNAAPNPTKVALFLEETGLPFEPVPVDTRKGDQFKPEFLKVNPNGKVPAIDDNGVFVFDSNAILLYLGEKTGKFMPPNTPTAKAQMLSWLMFIATGLGPYSGQAVHFKHAAPKDLEYAHNRYQYEAHRHYKILDDHLAKSRYMVGDTYTIVDMALWGWIRMAPYVLGDDAFTKYPNVKRVLDEVTARPAAVRAIALKDKFTFKTEMDEEAKHIMFGHLKTKVA